jgi:8-oxo-dGTP pyrophosphatase MutT (NUDIX family)
MNNLILQLLKVAEAGVAKKTDPGKWEAAKQQAKAKMGGKHSARAMQLATQIYKKNGGGYRGKEPSSSGNKLKKWTKQDWGWSGEQKKESSYNPSFVLEVIHRAKTAGKGVYLPKRAISALKSTESGRDKLRAASAAKSRATRKGEQFASHGLHEGKNRSKLGAYSDYRPRGTLYLTDGKGNVLADKPTDTYGSIAPFHFPGGGIFEEEKVDRLPTTEEILSGVEREALEELGLKLKNLRALSTDPTNIDMPEWWRERQRKKRGLDYKGISEFYTAAEPGDSDLSILGADNDAFGGKFYPIEEVAAALENSTNPKDAHYNLTMNQARLLRSLN